MFTELTNTLEADAIMGLALQQRIAESMSESIDKGINPVTAASSAFAQGMTLLLCVAVDSGKDEAGFVEIWSSIEAQVRDQIPGMFSDMKRRAEEIAEADLVGEPC